MSPGSLTFEPREWLSGFTPSRLSVGIAGLKSVLQAEMV